MSILSASSAFKLNAKAHGLFSSQTAFKKPTFNTNFNRTSNDCTRLSTLIYPKNLANKQNKATNIFINNEDPELIISEPIKKIKLAKDQSAFSVSMNNNTTQQNTVKPLRLTIEEVFNTADTKRARKSSLLEDCFDEGSSLSFISSHSSFDNLDDETNRTIGNTAATKDMQSLVVMDNNFGRLSYLNQGTMFFNNMESQSMFFPFSGQESVFQAASGYLGTLPEDVNNNTLCMPPNNLNAYIQFSMQTNQQALQLGLNLSEKTISEFVKNSIEDGYDSDSYATRSTSVEQESSDKSQKGASPVYSGNDDLYTEVQVKAKEDRLKAQLKRKAEKRANDAKEKKGRSLNLKLDVNPKQLKVQRRLNRLQLLRYQQGPSEEEDEELKKFGISDLLSRANSTIQECSEMTEATTINDYESQQMVFTQFVPADTKAVIPPLGEDSSRRKRGQLVQAWNPEVVGEEQLEEYLRQLGEVLENPVSDIEAAIKLLRESNMDMSLALETVKENKALYSEVFRLKVKRLRRRGV